MEADIAYIGDEDVNQEAMALIDRLLRDGEVPVAIAGFDFATKVIAITDQRVIIASGNDGLVLNLTHDDIYLMERDGRTLVTGTRSGEEQRHRFGKDDTVQELVEIAHRQRHPEGSQPTGTTSPTGSRAAQEERVGRRKAHPYRGAGQILGGAGPDQPGTDPQGDPAEWNGQNPEFSR